MMYAISYTWALHGVWFFFSSKNSSLATRSTFRYLHESYCSVHGTRFVSHLIQMNHFIFVCLCLGSLDFSSMRWHFTVFSIRLQLNCKILLLAFAYQLMKECKMRGELTQFFRVFFSVLFGFVLLSSVTT